MPLCSRETIPKCVVCGEPTMEAGTDDKPWAKSYLDGYVCSEACELRDKLEHAGPSSEWETILDAAHRLGQDHGDLTAVRIFRPCCTPVEGVVLSLGKTIPDVLLEDDNGDEVCVLQGMIERVEVVEDA